MDITVTMTEPEIKEAIRDFLRKHDVVSPNKEIDVNMVAGRGTNGHSAVISVKNAIPTLVEFDEPDTPENANRPPKEDPALPKQVIPVVQTPAQEQAQTPAQKVAINKNVPMPSAPKEPAEALFTAPGEEITAQASAEVNNLFGDSEPSTMGDAGSAQEFDPNNISEAASNQTVDSLFG